MIALLFVFACYLLGLLLVLRGWYRSIEVPLPERVSPTDVTVLIAFRDEVQNLPALVADLKKQQHAPREVILIDDHSADGSFALAERLTQDDARFRILRLPQGEGKKQAIAYGVSQATTAWICMTDADGRLPATWLSALQPQLASRPAMVIGPVYLPVPRTFLQRLQRVEWASLQAVTFATAALGRPVMCNGANLAFTQQAFVHARGYAGNEHIPSGDDEFLMRSIGDAGLRVAFCNDVSAAVITAPQSSLSALWHQRIRWASKWKHNRSRLAKRLAVGMLGFQVAYVVAVVMVCAGSTHASVLFALLGCKWVMEAIVLGAVAAHHGHRLDVAAFAAWQLLYPFYVVGVGLFSWAFTYTWKGRQPGKG
ncbi:MAG: glycosyltransferase [Cyclobacteriaceae bacterium]|nr:glycosyltransferase [Cyclobacteriaceae bacterium]